jgi:phage repressor protein C with HTH and peptisase S24 domain
MNTFSERVRNRRKELGLSQLELAKKAGLSQTTISDIERGRNDGSRELMPLAKALKVRPEWLSDGTIPMLYGMDESGYDNIQLGLKLTNPYRHRVPVVGTAQLGDDGYWAELNGPTGHGDGVVRFETKDPNAYAVRCRGHSMMPRIRDGEFVVLEPNKTPISGDDVLVRHLDGRVMVKRFLYERDGMIHLLSINEAFPPHAFPLEEIAVFHPVVGISMKSHWLPE